MNTILKKIIIGLLITVVTVTVGSMAIKSCQAKKEAKALKAARTNVPKTFQKSYEKTDATVAAESDSAAGATHSDVERRRFE